MKQLEHYLTFMNLMVIGIALIVGASLISCEKKTLPDISKYHEGDIVESILSGQRGQVIMTRCDVDALPVLDYKRRCLYDVRFQTMPMSTIMLMKDYELRPFKG